MRNTNNGSHITLAQAANLSPGRPSSCAVWRWCRKGIKARSGGRIRLAHIRAGGRIFTTVADLESFFERVAEADRAHFELTPEPPPKPKTSRQWERSIEHADAVLAKAGVLA